MSLFNFVKSNIAILDVIQDYVHVRRMGNYWKGSCPFHHETDASFTVSPDKQIFYCFGCHAGGDVIAFIAKAENCAQIDAVHHIVDRYKLNVPAEILSGSSQGGKTISVDEKNRYFFICEQVALWAHQELLTSNLGQEYITDRGITHDMVTYFLLGYVPGGTRGINKLINALSRVGILVKELIEWGILIENKGSYYSPFEERIIFPITDTLGRYCGFGGRIFRPHDERAKYYNSKDAPCFSKGKLLFGLNKAKDAMHKTDCAFMVEGYTDCISMVQYGFANTVATLGTACTVEHLKLLGRHVRTLYILYDGDNAGQKAVLRLAELCWEVNLELRVITLPFKEDPASFLSTGGNLKEAIDRAQDLFAFFVDAQGSSFFQKSISEKYERCTHLIEVIAQIPDAFKRDLLIQRAAEVMQIPFDSLKSLLLQQLEKNLPIPTDHTESANMSGSVENGSIAELPLVGALEKQIIFAIINNVQELSFYQLPEDLQQCFSQPAQALLSLCYEAHKHPVSEERFTIFISSLNEYQKQWVTRHLMTYGEAVSKELFEQYVNEFRRQYWKQEVQNIKCRLLKAQHDQDQTTYQELMHRFISLQRQMKSKGLL